MADSIQFHTSGGAVSATPSATGPAPTATGARIRIDVTAAEVQHAYDAGAFDLSEVIPGGDVPGIRADLPVTLELRLADEYEEMLATSSREPGVLIGDLLALTQTNPVHLLLDAGSWQVTAVIQPGTELHYTTLHDWR